MLTIAHLYPYELSLYGENGNIKALIYELNKQNIKYKIVLIDKEDKLEFSKYDLVYIGSGRPKYLEEVKKRLFLYKKEILSYIENNGILLATGNATYILDFLELYEIKYCEKRQVHDVLATTSLCKGVIKGFQNTEYQIASTKNILFNIEEGCGNNNTQLEGYKEKNFYATTIIGPILARNDNLNHYFISLLTHKKNVDNS